MTSPSPQNLPDALSCWVITNGMAGFEAQALGVAEALGVQPIIIRVCPRAPWRWIAPYGRAPYGHVMAKVSLPWPRLLIASGRQSIPYARQIRHRSGGETFVVILQDPKVSPAAFDMVWTPAHDRLEGANVLKTLTSPNRITPEKLQEAAHRFRPLTAGLVRPLVAVLIGGSNRNYDLSPQTMRTICKRLDALTQIYGVHLLISPSRRTGTAQTRLLRDYFVNRPALVWDGGEPNPYPGFLALADKVIVTCDSVNMVGEAVTTGKPVYVMELEGGSPRFRRFLDGMYASGAARPFEGLLEDWDYIPINATHAIATAITTAMRQRQTQGA